MAASAYTPFRLQQKLLQLRAIDKSIESLAAEYCYFINLNEQWQESQTATLTDLLTASPFLTDEE